MDLKIHKMPRIKYFPRFAPKVVCLFAYFAPENPKELSSAPSKDTFPRKWNSFQYIDMFTHPSKDQQQTTIRYRPHVDTKNGRVLVKLFVFFSPFLKLFYFYFYFTCFCFFIFISLFLLLQKFPNPSTNLCNSFPALSRRTTWLHYMGCFWETISDIQERS